jgi:hypothetical protein
MGAGNSCAIDSFSSACQMYKCVKTIQGLNAQSQSPSDQWIVDLQPGTTYKNVPIEKCFLKYWIDQKEVKTPHIIGLNYELWVYAHVIQDIVDQRICPNFSRYLASGKRCTFDDLQRIATASHVDVINLKRNILILAHQQQGRPAVHVNLGYNQQQLNFIQQNEEDIVNATYRLLVIEFVSGKSLLEYITTTKFNEETWEVLFQLAVGCYALLLSKTAHNDLHAGNAIISVNENPVPTTYKIDGKTYTMNIKMVPKIFDFDLGFVQRYKPNQFLRYEEDMHNGKSIINRCAAVGACNEIVSGKDICKVFGYVYRQYKDPEILKVLFHEGKLDVNAFVNQFMQKQPASSSDYGNPIDSDWYRDNIRPLPEIIDEISKKCRLKQRESDNVYDCSSYRFAEDGRVIKQNRAELELLREREARIKLQHDKITLQTAAAANERKRQHSNKLSVEVKKEKAREKFKATTESLQQKLSLAERTNNALKAKLESQGNGPLMQMLENEKEARNQLEVKLRNLEEESTQVKKQLATANEQIGNWTSQLASVRDKLKQATTTTQMKDQQIAHLNAELATVKNENKALFESKAKVPELEKLNKKSEREKQVGGEQLQKALNDVATLTNKIKESDRENQEVSEHLKKANQELIDVKAEYKNLKRAFITSSMLGVGTATAAGIHEFMSKKKVKN